jgi:hypothetical protein
MVFDEGATDVAALFHMTYVSFITNMNSGNMNLFELQLGQIVTCLRQ